MYEFQAFTTPGRIYHTPNQMYYFQGDDWYGLGQEEGPPTALPNVQRRLGRWGTVGLSLGLYGVSLVGLTALHRKQDLSWYCSIVPSIFWSGGIAGGAMRLLDAVL